MKSRANRLRLLRQLCWICLVSLLSACGSNGSRRATDQLLMSDAVDQSVAQIDFRALRGKKVYLDTKYLTRVKGFDYVNSDYITSSLRQQMFAAGCLVQDEPEKADYVAEARVGALGTDSHDLVYGLPASSAVSSAAALMPNAPPIPAIPEISVARKAEQQGASKIAVFIYHRETRQPVWQSGIALSRSTSKDRWILGAGPFQSGTIHENTQFAGNDVGLSELVPWGDKEEERTTVVPIDREVHFQNLLPLADGTKVELATFDEPIEDEKKSSESDEDDTETNADSDNSKSAD
jgi:hypothetical protein